MNIVEIVIYFLILLILLAPLRLAYLALLCLAFFDASGSNWASASSLNIVNALKVIGAPIILLFRQKIIPIKITFLNEKSFVFYCYLFLTIYASITIFWTPDFLRLSAFKGIVYLFGHIVWFSVISYGLITNKIKVGMLFKILMIGLIVGITQTYLVKGNFGVTIYGEDRRFTVFSSPQSFAAFLTYILAIILFLYNSKLLFKITIVALIIIMIVMTGSRYSFIASFWIIFNWLIFNIVKSKSVSEFFVKLSSTMLVIVFVVLIVVPISATFVNDSRIAELFKGDISRVQTFAWRIGMWNEAVRQISEFSYLEILLGRGTSSSALVALSYDSHYDPHTIDANRVMHNEFLRALYEWGIIGLIFLGGFWIGLIFTMIYWIFKNEKRGYFLSSLLGPFTSGLLIENILAGSGTPVGIGIILALASLSSLLFDKNKLQLYSLKPLLLRY